MLVREDGAFEVEAGLPGLGRGGEAVVDGDAVWVDHWLLSGKCAKGEIERGIGGKGDERI